MSYFKLLNDAAEIKYYYSYMYSIHLILGGTVAEPNSRSCPPGVPVVFCLVNPCNFATCANFPNARCIFDNCGGCNARFFVGSSREVTGRCTAGGK